MTKYNAKDSLGKKELNEKDLFGIHTARAFENFPKSNLKNYITFYKAMAQVKMASAVTNQELGFLENNLAKAIIFACQEMVAAKHFDSLIVDPIQGGAGTSFNMNINEIIASRAEEILKLKKGSLDIHSTVNLHQSTNDTYPTAIKIATYYLLQELENNLNKLLLTMQKKEKEFSDIIKIARTQLMSAVPYTLGKEFSAFAEAIARDRWRIFKCLERVRTVNIGGTAIGTGLCAPKAYILRVINNLQEITNLPLARAENLIDATQNNDLLAEVFALIKVLAINLEKIANDLRLLAAFSEIEISPVQEGSSIMPGKYNPVILEMLSIVAKKTIGNELIASLCFANGELELNAFLPLASYVLFESLDLLSQSVNIFDAKCLKNIKANKINCQKNLFISPSASTILIPKIGIKKAKLVAEYMLKNKVDLIIAVKKLAFIKDSDLKKLLTAKKLNELGS